MPLFLPDLDGAPRALEWRRPAELAPASAPPTSRRVFAAAHVVPDPWRSSRAGTYGGEAAIDLDTTLALRHRLWSYGLGVAEAMDTAQRGMGLPAAAAMELARRTMADDPRGGAGVAVGVTTDALTSTAPTLQEVADAYRRQVAVVAAGGGTPVVMASRHLARVAQTPADYRLVYDQVISEAPGPVFLHWLGPAFDDTLAGYWGTTDTGQALDTVVDLLHAWPGRVQGIKVSLLDPVLEVRLRQRAPEGVDVFTGDDFHYTDMIAGDGRTHSHALLGAFAALAPWASAAFRHLDAGDEAAFRAVLEPTQAVSRVVFEAPTQFYKTGIAWLSYLDGLQPHFRMLDGLESGRSLLHLVEVVRRANTIGYFTDPDRTEERLRSFLRAQGVD